jgi:hypothetical protein
MLFIQPALHNKICACCLCFPFLKEREEKCTYGRENAAPFMLRIVEMEAADPNMALPYNTHESFKEKKPTIRHIRENRKSRKVALLAIIWNHRQLAFSGKNACTYTVCMLAALRPLKNHVSVTRVLGYTAQAWVRSGMKHTSLLKSDVLVLSGRLQMTQNTLHSLFHMGLVLRWASLLRGIPHGTTDPRFLAAWQLDPCRTMSRSIVCS